ncbi:cytochrome P450 [Promicromonospora iranensis]|uniref:Cytochrome P450 n=1 Tax=Promicromonospora iranensis TaxID=1105144 RepID=A0ABU2CWV9_9MICO|nr:cytochrome P450 [Promicromonospora iranensis]MDR7385771.1 cytochrome P450 [Promicromonospora iranensis]
MTVTTTTQSERLIDLDDLTPLIETTTSADPAAVYERLRARWGNVAPVLLEPGVPAWLVLGHRELVTVLRNESLFARDSRNWGLLADGTVRPDSGVGGILAPRDGIYYVDGVRHRHLRRLIDDAFEGIDEHRLATIVEQWCGVALDRLLAEGEADLVNDYARAVPLLVMSTMFGLDAEQSRAMLGHAQRVFQAKGAAGGAALNAQRALIADLIASRRAEPSDDLTSAILRHPSAPTDLDAQSAVSATLILGSEFEVAWITQALRLRLTDPRFDGRAGGRLSASDTLAAALGSTPPATNTGPRFVLADTTLGGRKIWAGDAVVPGILGASAESRGSSDDIWLESGHLSYLTWGAGPHACPARRPATVIAQVAVGEALRRLGGVTLTVPPETLRATGTLWSSVPRELPVRFEAQHPAR